MFKLSTILTHLKISRKRLLLTLLGISSLAILLVYAINKPETKVNYKTTECYLPGISGDTRFPLEDILRSNETPTLGRTIFFHETSCHPPDTNYVLDLSARKACSIESAALHNPNFRIFVLFASYTRLPRDNPMLNAIRSYKNVYLRQLNMWDYVKDTPIEKWFQKGDLFQSNFIVEHTSDLLRILTLYRYGGIYLDLDVVVQRTMEFIPLNFLGAHDSITLGNAVLGLTPFDPGHRFAKLLLIELQTNYFPAAYVGNGPSLVTRVLRGFCNIKSVDNLIAKSDSCGFKVFNSSAFYPIDSGNWSILLDSKFTNIVMNQTKDSYLIHFWNKNDATKRIRIEDGSAYAKLAQKNCPRTVAAAGEYF